MDLSELRDIFHDVEARRASVWDDLWARRPIGRIALSTAPNRQRLERARRSCANVELREPVPLPPAWQPAWREHLLADLADTYARSELPGDGFLGLGIPKHIYGQSQGLSDVFGARVEAMPDGNFYVHPLSPDPDAIKALAPKSLRESMYSTAVEYVRYAREATAGVLPIRAPVMTGPLDTANYLLGTTVLMEWVYTQPDVLHGLLAKITDVVAKTTAALHEAAGGRVEPSLLWCMRGGPDICSECRALISTEMGRAGALVEPLKCVTTVVRAAAVDFGDAVAVVGCGFMGLAAVAALGGGYLRELVAVDRVEDRLQLALELGATAALSPSRCDVLAEIRRRTSGRGADAVIEFAGSTRAATLAASLVRTQGRLVVAGGRIPQAEDTGQYDALYLGAFTTHYVPPMFSPDPGDNWWRAIEALLRGRYPHARLLTHTFALSRIQDAFETAADGDGGRYRKGIVINDLA